jgi:hypothetical protein
MVNQETGGARIINKKAVAPKQLMHRNFRDAVLGTSRQASSSVEGKSPVPSPRVSGYRA